MDVISLWNNTLADIKKEVSTANFFFLFNTSTLLSLEGNTAVIGVRSSMAITMIKKKYALIVKTALEKQAKKTLHITFITENLTAPTVNDLKPLFETAAVPQKPTGHLPRVRTDFIFETLAVSDSNRLAYESAKTVSKNLGGVYNPLFIYGPVGVGKTHLMQAIANEVYTKTPALKIIYITSEEFTNEFVEAIKSADMAKMKRKFRSVNLLIIDDVQFIAGKEKVQEELFHTFNTLIDSGAQIALSSDRPPNEIKKLETRLSSRFAGGLTIDIEAPDFETRTAIILKKAERMNITVPIEVAKAIAEKEQDVRSLEGTLLRVITEAKTSGKDLTLDLTDKTLNNSPKTLHFHSEDIIEHTCVFYNLKPTQLKGPKRDAFLVRARHVSMYILKKEMGLSFMEIGNILGGRDHTTVMHGVEKVEKMLENIPILSEEILSIVKALGG